MSRRAPLARLSVLKKTSPLLWAESLFCQSLYLRRNGLYELALDKAVEAKRYNPTLYGVSGILMSLYRVLKMNEQLTEEARDAEHDLQGREYVDETSIFEVANWYFINERFQHCFVMLDHFVVHYPCTKKTLMLLLKSAVKSCSELPPETLHIVNSYLASHSQNSQFRVVTERLLDKLV